MSNIELNKEYTDGEFTGTCTLIAKGWVTLTNSEGEEKKFRAKSLKEVGEQPLINMSAKLAAARKTYKKAGDTYHCNDLLANAMHGKELGEVYTIAAELLEFTEDELYAKYEHLNAGAQRMNLGNRIRSQFKKGNETVVSWVEANQPK